MVRGIEPLSDDQPISEEEERRLDQAVVCVWFFLGAVVLFLLGFLAIVVGVFSFIGGAHPAEDAGGNRSLWITVCVAVGLISGVSGWLMCRGGARRVKAIQQRRHGFPIA